MKKGSSNGWFWQVFTFFVVLTWILWFLGVDIRDVKTLGENKINELKANAEANYNSQGDGVYAKCMKSFEECKSISTQKYGVTITLLKAEKFEDSEKAKEFYKAWAGPTQSLIVPAFSELPVVLIAERMTGPNGQTPRVLICDSSGNLDSGSKRGIGCEV